MDVPLIRKSAKRFIQIITSVAETASVHDDTELGFEETTRMDLVDEYKWNFNKSIKGMVGRMDWRCKNIVFEHNFAAQLTNEHKSQLVLYCMMLFVARLC
eukprot:272244-Pleurochrysis_carterae.AAC.1